MSRLSNTVRLDSLLQARYKVYAIVVGTALGLGLALRAVATPEELNFIMPVMIMYGVSLSTVFLVGVLLLLERGEGTLDVVMVSPLRPSEYLAAKRITLAALALVESAVMAVGADGRGAHRQRRRAATAPRPRRQHRRSGALAEAGVGLGGGTNAQCSV